MPQALIVPLITAAITAGGTAYGAVQSTNASDSAQKFQQEQLQQQQQQAQTQQQQQQEQLQQIARRGGTDVQSSTSGSLIGPAFQSQVNDIIGQPGGTDVITALSNIVANSGGSSPTPPPTSTGLSGGFGNTSNPPGGPNLTDLTFQYSGAS